MPPRALKAENYFRFQVGVHSQFQMSGDLGKILHMFDHRPTIALKLCWTIGLISLFSPGSASAAPRKAVSLIAASTRLDDLGPWTPTGYHGPVTEGVHRVSVGIGTEWGFSFFGRMEFTAGAQYIQRNFKTAGESYRAHLVQVPLGLRLNLPLGLHATGGFAFQQNLSMSSVTGGSAVAITPQATGLKPLLGRLYYGAGCAIPIGGAGRAILLGAQYFTDEDNASENFPTKRLFRDLQVQVGLSFSK